MHTLGRYPIIQGTQMHLCQNRAHISYKPQQGAIVPQYRIRAISCLLLSDATNVPCKQAQEFRDSQALHSQTMNVSLIINNRHTGKTKPSDLRAVPPYTIYCAEALTPCATAAACEVSESQTADMIMISEQPLLFLSFCCPAVDMYCSIS